MGKRIKEPGAFYSINELIFACIEIIVDREDHFVSSAIRHLLYPHTSSSINRDVWA